MRKIWYLKQEKGQNTKTAKLFLYEKNGHVKGRMDLSAFCNCGQEERKTILLHMKDVSGKDVGQISLEEGNVSYDGFLQEKGKLKEELADKLRALKGNAELSVTTDKERYLSEGWIDKESVSEKAEIGIEETERKGKEQTKEKGQKKGKEHTKEDEKTEWVEEKEQIAPEEAEEKEEKRETDKDGKKNKSRKKEEQRETEEVTGREDTIEELEAEELLQEEAEEKRIVQLSVLEDELLFRSYIHNSFLLHGYYNYGHVMIDESGEEPRLGVPGNYYEWEQMVAEMFGFPVFEPAREGEHITNGTFGYFYTKG